MSARETRPRLGKGLGALLSESMLASEGEGNIRRLRVDQIVPNPFQPRREFTPDELEELRESIRINGLLQPPVVRPAPGGGTTAFELVAGERRFRCVRELGWKEIPVLVRDVDDRTLLVLALVENLQREELGVLEEAEGYRVLSEDFGMTQAEIAESVGKKRPTVANALRLLRLPASVRRQLGSGELSMGHARALLGIEDPGRQLELARRAVEQGWSVREMEDRIRGNRTPAPSGSSGGPGASRSETSMSPVLRALQEELRHALGTRASVREGKAGAGKIEIPYHSNSEFERLFQLLTGTEAGDVAG
ncbi:MAG: ParB/RepB/Spo0J family partition protein [Gemmatimonadales bacterium]|nr:MAG: ParB/RepB/Spo0J family partition protein [Gemmatimonadales bacterium]